MNTRQSNLKLLSERRDKLRLELEAVKARLDEVEAMIRMMSGESVLEAAPSQRRPRRGDLKEIVLALYEEAAEEGLSAADCVTAARERRGVELQPASVSSLLSRLKADDVLFYDGLKYRLKRYAGPRPAAAKEAL
jgi:hypothetical protein